MTSDPATSPDTIKDADIIIFLINKGLPSPLFNYEFPKSNYGRRFVLKNYKRKLDNGEILYRDWLVYSPTIDCVYCFCCKLFNVNISFLGKNGFNNWKYIGDVLKYHETSKSHMETKKSWSELKRRINSSETIDAQCQTFINYEINYWNEVLLRVVSVIKMLGTCDQFYQYNNGNFLKLIELKLFKTNSV